MFIALIKSAIKQILFHKIYAIKGSQKLFLRKKFQHFELLLTQKFIIAKNLPHVRSVLAKLFIFISKKVKNAILDKLVNCAHNVHPFWHLLFHSFPPFSWKNRFGDPSDLQNALFYIFHWFLSLNNSFSLLYSLRLLAAGTEQFRQVHLNNHILFY